MAERSFPWVWKSGKQRTLPTFTHPRLRRRSISITRYATLTISLVQKIEQSMLTNPLPDVFHSDPIDPGGTLPLVSGNAPPNIANCAAVSKPTPQVSPCKVWVRLALLIKFALHAEYPNFIGLAIRVHRYLLRHANLSSSCSPSPCARFSRARTTTGTPPSVSPVTGRHV